MVFQIPKSEMKKHHTCSCRQCVAACQSHPGSLMPGDLRRLAKYLGMTEQELFNEHIAVLDLGWVRVPFPAARYLPAGQVTTNDDDRWDLRCCCYWLNEDNLCLVHNAKPTECAEAMLCKDSPYKRSPRRVKTCYAWSRQKNRERLARLLGEKKNARQK